MSSNSSNLNSAKLSSNSPQLANFARTHAPSVPISLYKEVISELNFAKVEIAKIRVENQQLIEQNQKLRQEIERLFRSSYNLQQKSSLGNEGVNWKIDRPHSLIGGKNYPPKGPILPPKSSSYPREHTFAEVDDKQLRNSTGADSTPTTNGWMLALAIFAIVLTAFASGFLIVRPLLNNNNQ
jgi:hypothetical protein